jgi:hypothetical protein
MQSINPVDYLLFFFRQAPHILHADHQSLQIREQLP